jgi:hypothetical protein
MLHRGGSCGRGERGGGPGRGSYGSKFIDTGCSKYTDDMVAPVPPTQHFESVNVKHKFAVDGSTLQMDCPRPVPRAHPMEGNHVDPKAFQTILQDLQAVGLEAELLLCKALATLNTSVYTNYFALNVDPKLSL